MDREIHDENGREEECGGERQGRKKEKKDVVVSREWSGRVEKREGETVKKERRVSCEESMKRRWAWECEEKERKKRVLREGNRVVVERGAKREKEMTGEEMRKMILKRNEEQVVKKGIREEKKMVKEGKMKRLDSYFK